jgi:hypothetical protein
MGSKRLALPKLVTSGLTLPWAIPCGFFDADDIYELTAPDPRRPLIEQGSRFRWIAISFFPTTNMAIPSRATLMMLGQRAT